MNKTQILLSLLVVFIFQSSLFAKDDALKPIKKTVLKIESVPDTVVLGSAFQLHYELVSPIGDIGDITFPDNVTGFGIPQLLKHPRIGNTITKEEDGTEHYGYSGSFIYAIVPTTTGNLTIPQATILIDGKPYKAENRNILVVPSEKPLRQVKAQLQFPSDIKKGDEFTVKVVIEGDCEGVNQFTVYLPKVSWADEKDNRYGDLSEPRKKYVTNNKHEYLYRMKAREAGDFLFPSTIIWIPEDKTHFLADHIKEVKVADSDYNPRDVRLKVILPDSIVQGVPFTFYYLLTGEVNNIKEYGFESDQVEGLDQLKTPIYQFINSSAIVSEIEEYIHLTETAYVCESRAERSGSITIPSFSIVIDGKKHSVDSFTINVLPREEENKINVNIRQIVPERVFLPKSFWYETQITTYSGFFNDIKINQKEAEKQIANKFIILDYVVDDNSKSLTNRFREPYIESTRTYKWKLKAKKEGEFKLPELKFVINNSDFVQKMHSIKIVSKPDKNDVEVTFDSIVVLGSELKINFKLKNRSWRIIDAKMNPISSYGFKEVETDLPVLKAVNRESFSLSPIQTGRLMIPPVFLETDNGDIFVDSLFIDVLPIDRFPIKSTPQSIVDEDIYVKAELSKTKAYPNEAILLTEKLYSRISLDNWNHPEYETTRLASFHPEKNNIFNAGEYSVKESVKTKKLEHINGRNYNTYVLRKTLLFPSEVGFPDLLETNFTVFLRMKNKDDENVEVKWESGGVTSERIEVIPFPIEGRPDSFDGLVGDFSIRSELNKVKVKQNDSLILVVEIEGIGSGNLLDSMKPNIKTKGCRLDSFDEKDDNVSYKGISAEGLEAVKQYRYKVDTSVKGRYTIPSVELSYFNSKQRKYVTKKTKPISFTIN